MIHQIVKTQIIPHKTTPKIAHHPQRIIIVQKIQKTPRLIKNLKKMNKVKWNLKNKNRVRVC